MRSAIVSLLIATAWALVPATAAAQGATTGADKGRSYAAGHFLLELEGQACGAVESATGGHAVGEVVQLAPGADRVARKQISRVRYEDITLEVGLDLVTACPPLLDWIRGTLAPPGGKRRNGVLLTAGLQGQDLGRLAFQNGLIAEIEFPGLDGASKESASLTIRITPESTRPSKPSGAKLPVSTKAGSKRWLASNFRFRVAGLEAATQRVTKIEAFSVKQRVASDAAGAQRESSRAAGLEIPNLSFLVPEQDVGPLCAWFEDFVLRGNSGQDRERSATLEWLSPTQEVLATLRLEGVGIFRCAPAETASDQQIRRIRAEVYVEKMDLTVK